MHPRKKKFREVVIALEWDLNQHFQTKPSLKSQSLSDRVRRSVSWLKRATEVAEDDKPPRFVDLWIGLNALYGTRHYGDDYSAGEHQDWVLPRFYGHLT